MPHPAFLLCLASWSFIGSLSAMYGRGDFSDALILLCATYVLGVAAVLRAIGQDVGEASE